MVDRVTEVLEDGTVYSFDLDKCSQTADQVMADLAKREGVELDFDYLTTVFGLYVHCIHTLSAHGWTTAELIAEAIAHSEADDADEFRSPDYDDEDDE